ncbi:hypothetical protein ABUE31_10520 [Mesorhizobium sp. ZMM04-5]|uniref:Lipoprotein n=1 Tax=Mesorhizobium marinum TaxID=3228790 RepID=A0ABV3R013_9HYPH
MNKKLLAGTALLFSAMALSACAPVETRTSLTTPVANGAMTAGPGDVVLNFQSRRALPNAFGKADLFGRTTNAGGTTVRYVGSRGGRAVFERTDVQVVSNATTMSDTPLIVPATTNTRVTGVVGHTPVTGQATSTSYRYVPPRGSSEYATAQQPITFSLDAGRCSCGNHQRPSPVQGPRRPEQHLADHRSFCLRRLRIAY